MKLTPKELALLQVVAIDAAQKAGQMVSNITGQSINVQKKIGGSSEASQVLAEVDLKSQEIILNALEPTLEKFDLALLSEEIADDKSRLQKEHFWCVDPLDGTLPFTESKPGYAVSIALLSKDGDPQLGIVYDPVTSTLYTARKGMGAKKNRSKWVLKEPTKSKKLTWIMDRSLRDHHNFSEYLHKMETFASEQQCELNIISHGGAVMNALWTLENAPAVYFKPARKTPGGGSLWDFAATTLIAKETGGVASDFFGNQLNLNRSDSTFMGHKGVIYASNRRLHKRLQEIVTD